MKIKTKRIISCIAFSLGLLLLLLAASYIFMPKNNTKKFGMNMRFVNGIYGENTDTIDVLFFGDSESYSAFSPMQIWDNYGISSYVCGTSGQYLCWTESFLHNIFEMQKPKVVVLETNEIYRNMSVSDVASNELENIFSVFRYHNRWKSMKISELGLSVDYTWTDDFKGFYYSEHSAAAKAKNYMRPSKAVEGITALNKKYVKSIASICKKNGANLILVSTPSTKNWNSRKHNGVASLAKDVGIPFIDLNTMADEIKIDWKKDSRDRGDHLNYFGAEKVTKYIGKYLSGNFKLTDHRNEPAYEKWNDALQRYNTLISSSASSPQNQ